MTGELDAALRRKRILVVEDEADVRTLITRKFESEGYANVVGLGTGEQALAALAAAEIERDPFHLVLLDLMLPDLQGEEALARIRERYRMPVIVVSARREREKVLEVLAKGADDHVGKPFDGELLLFKAEKLLTRYHLEDQLRNSTRRNQRLFLNILQVMAKILEAKDPYTKFHSENVAKYARQIAKRLGYSAKELELIQTAGILHDFGKIGVKEGVLNKAGHLTDAEMDSVKRHPVIAATILEPIEELHTIIADIRHHHEYWNGCGYPDGLQGSDIPLGARILMVADAFDAMSSERSYHEAMTRAEAIEEIRRCSETQFDPEIVKVFIEILEEEAQREAALAARRRARGAPPREPEG